MKMKHRIGATVLAAAVLTGTVVSPAMAGTADYKSTVDGKTHTTFLSGDAVSNRDVALGKADANYVGTVHAISVSDADKAQLAKYGISIDTSRMLAETQAEIAAIKDGTSEGDRGIKLRATFDRKAFDKSDFGKRFDLDKVEKDDLGDIVATLDMHLDNPQNIRTRKVADTKERMHAGDQFNSGIAALNGGYGGGLDLLRKQTEDNSFYGTRLHPTVSEMSGGVVKKGLGGAPVLETTFYDDYLRTPQRIADLTQAGQREFPTTNLSECGILGADCGFYVSPMLSAYDKTAKIAADGTRAERPTVALTNPIWISVESDFHKELPAIRKANSITITQDVDTPDNPKDPWSYQTEKVSWRAYNAPVNAGVEANFNFVDGTTEPNVWHAANPWFINKPAVPKKIPNPNLSGAYLWIAPSVALNGGESAFAPDYTSVYEQIPTKPKPTEDKTDKCTTNCTPPPPPVPHEKPKPTHDTGMDLNKKPKDPVKPVIPTPTPTPTPTITEKVKKPKPTISVQSQKPVPTIHTGFTAPQTVGAVAASTAVGLTADKPTVPESSAQSVRMQAQGEQHKQIGLVALIGAGIAAVIGGGAMLFRRRKA